MINIDQYHIIQYDVGVGRNLHPKSISLVVSRLYWWSTMSGLSGPQWSPPRLQGLKHQRTRSVATGSFRPAHCLEKAWTDPQILIH